MPWPIRTSDDFMAERHFAGKSSLPLRLDGMTLERGHLYCLHVEMWSKTIDSFVFNRLPATTPYQQAPQHTHHMQDLHQCARRQQIRCWPMISYSCGEICPQQRGRNAVIAECTQMEDGYDPWIDNVTRCSCSEVCSYPFPIEKGAVSDSEQSGWNVTTWRDALRKRKSAPRFMTTCPCPTMKPWWTPPFNLQSDGN